MDGEITKVPLYLEPLGVAEREIYEQAVAFLRKALPLPNELYAYTRLNLEYQDSLSNLQSNVLYICARTNAKMKAHESKLRNFARDEIKAKDERDTEMFADSKWHDMHMTVSTLTILAKRLDALSWSLKSALNAVSR